MMGMKKETVESLIGTTIAWCIVITILLVIVIVVSNYVPSKPMVHKPIEIKIPSSNKVGESTGKAVGGFGFGFVKGLYKSAVPDKKVKDEATNSKIDSVSGDTNLSDGLN